MLRRVLTGTALLATAAALWGCGSSTPASPDGGKFVLPDGSIYITDGQIRLPDGNIVSPDGSTVMTDASTVVLDGGTVCYQTLCRGALYQCGDCTDNDGDGKIDANDPDCLGPCDNNEAGFDPQIPGGGSGTGSCTLDCYFDDNSGSGGGDCEWDVRCDPLSPGTDWPGSSCAYNGDPNATVSGNFDCQANFNDQFGQHPTCQSNCQAWTPNGCDCFGCCYFASAVDPATNPNGFVLIGSKDSGGNRTCTLDVVADQTKCQPCTPVPSCENTDCLPGGPNECALCLGQTVADLPPSCFPSQDAGVDGGTDAGTPLPTCSGGEQPCDATVPCAAGFYCLTGCCVPAPA